ncbi:hypothetical protein [Salipiger abyssi]|uniref:hypothetical protein n=1 Tax=Salipiger abyssi TaxID=1250539 RepID=UPI00405947C1
MEAHHSPVCKLHHFACSGGKMVAKCVAVCGDMSDVNPLAPYNDIKFAPLGLLSQFQAQYRMAFVGDQMCLLPKVPDQAQRPICHRDHVLSSIFRPGGVRESEFLEVLGYDTLSIATVQYPVDAFAAMLQNKCAGGIQISVEIYCTKLMAFLNYCTRREAGPAAPREFPGRLPEHQAVGGFRLQKHRYSSQHVAQHRPRPRRRGGRFRALSHSLFETGIHSWRRRVSVAAGFPVALNAISRSAGPHS